MGVPETHHLHEAKFVIVERLLSYLKMEMQLHKVQEA